MLDSVAALVTKQEIEGDMGDSHVGVQARLMSQALRKLAGAISKSNCVAIFINQLREKVGVVYGNPEVTPGGRALKFYSSVRLEVRKGEALKAGKSSGDRIGSRTKVKVVKNKVAPPFKEAEFDIMFGQGISRVGELLDLAVDADIVNKSGAWFSYEGTRLGQGRDNVKQLFLDNPELAKEIENKVMESIDKLNTRTLKPSKSKVADEADSDSDADNTAPEQSLEDERAAKRSSVAAKKANIDILVED